MGESACSTVHLYLHDELSCKVERSMYGMAALATVGGSCWIFKRLNKLRTFALGVVYSRIDWMVNKLGRSKLPRESDRCSGGRSFQNPAKQLPRPWVTQWACGYECPLRVYYRGALRRVQPYGVQPIEGVGVGKGLRGNALGRAFPTEQPACAEAPEGLGRQD